MGGLWSAAACALPGGRSDISRHTTQDERRLLEALEEGAEPAVLQRILARGGVIEHGGTVLHQALVTGALPSALLLLRQGRLALHRRDSYLLILALQQPRTALAAEVLRLLLAQGVGQGFNVNYVHHDGDEDSEGVYTPLAYALVHRLPEAALLLLQHGADPTFSLGSLYQGRYTPFSEWCRQVLLTPLGAPAAPAPGRAGPGTHRRTRSRSGSGDSSGAVDDSARVVALGFKVVPAATAAAASGAEGGGGADTFFKARFRPGRRAKLRAAAAGGARGPAARAAAAARKGSRSGELSRDQLTTSLREYQRTASMAGVGAEPHAQRGQATRARLAAGNAMASRGLARAMLAGGADPNECVGQSEVFSVVGVPALQHCLAWPGVVRELLWAGAAPEGHPGFAVTPLLQACDSMDVPWETVHWLLAAGADANGACSVPEQGDGRVRSASVPVASAGGAGARRGTVGAPPSPPPLARAASAPMTPFEALCGRLLEELGDSPDGGQADLRPGTLLPVDGERIAALLVDAGAAPAGVAACVALLRGAAPEAGRALRRVVAWHGRRGLVLHRAGWRAAHPGRVRGGDSGSLHAHSTKSAPAGLVPPGVPRSSRQLLLHPGALRADTACSPRGGGKRPGYMFSGATASPRVQLPAAARLRLPVPPDSGGGGGEDTPPAPPAPPERQHSAGSTRPSLPATGSSRTMLSGTSSVELVAAWE